MLKKQFIVSIEKETVFQKDELQATIVWILFDCHRTNSRQLGLLNSALNIDLSRSLIN